jgi:hypothetical protein
MSISAGPKIIKDSSLVLNIDPSNYKSYPAAQDSNSNNVSLMLDFDGSNGSTTFIDKSINALTVTAVSTASISTSNPKFGTGSLNLNGTSDYIAITGNASVFSFPGDFTVEGWVYFNVLPSASNYAGFFFARGASASASAFQFYMYNNAGTYRLETTISVGSTDYGNAYNLSSTPSTGVWYHFAFVRSGSSLIAYWDGLQVGSTATVSGTTNTPSTQISVGARGTPFTGLYLNGKIDGFRVSKAARYTANFTPPTIPFLLPGQIIDLTKNKAIATLTNGPTYSSGAITLDGVNDYITSPFSSNYNFGSGDFTVSAWINMTSLPSNSYSTFITHGVNGTSQRWLLYYDTRTSQSSPGLRFTSVNASNGVNIDISVGNTTGWSAGAWYFVAITRVGNIFTLYRNGVQIGNTVTDTDSIIDVTSNGLYLGVECTTTDGRLNGKISLVQIYKGRGLSSSEMYNNFVANRGRFGV